MQPPIMLCKTWDHKRLPPPLYASYKLDGVRGLYDPAKMVIVSRKYHEIPAVQHIADKFAEAKVDTFIDMELVVPDTDFHTSSGIIRRKYATQYDVSAYALDIYLPNEASFYSRQLHLEHLVKVIGSDYIQFLYSRRCETIDAINAEYKEALDKGYEGLVLKRPYHLYRNSRSYDWCRYVPSVQVDGVVKQIMEGEGKYAASVGAVIVEFEFGETATVGVFKGITDSERLQWAANPDLIVGKTVIVEYKETTPDGRLRQPRIKGIRYDK